MTSLIFHNICTTDFFHFVRQLYLPKLTPWHKAPSPCLLSFHSALSPWTWYQKLPHHKWMGSVITVCVSFCVHTARIVGLVYCDWEFEKPKDDFQSFDLEENCNLAK